ncbi:hypothetical protein [Brevibacillus laterosporus]|uniref:hypothetical protein n=1 Tax=Brevibacillus laterosporus TaxID=1465 RepID=UPI0018F89E64|nr:hypothetical protein [Brevibacillus laterosporus]MBG9776152.1 hypothetical protein [Brevibacillus laterosporus]
MEHKQTDLITRDMVHEFNNILKDERSIIRLHITGESGTVDIKLKEDTYIKMDFILNFEDYFYNKLKDFLQARASMICNLIIHDLVFGK